MQRDIKSILATLEKVLQEIEELKKENVFLKQENAFLRQKNQELKAKLNSNSGNSSRPPLNDGYRKKPALPKAKEGRYKRTKGGNLVEQLIRKKEAILAFAFNEEVFFTNNLAERDIRPVKIKMKISNCFRSFISAEIYSRIESFISTARKQNKNVFKELCNSFEGHNFLSDMQSC